MPIFYRCDFCNSEIENGDENDLGLTELEANRVIDDENYYLCNKCYGAVKTYVAVLKDAKQKESKVRK